MSPHTASIRSLTELQTILEPAGPSRRNDATSYIPMKNGVGQSVTGPVCAIARQNPKNRPKQPVSPTGLLAIPNPGALCLGPFPGPHVPPAVMRRSPDSHRICSSFPSTESRPLRAGSRFPVPSFACFSGMIAWAFETPNTFALTQAKSSFHALAIPATNMTPVTAATWVPERPNACRTGPGGPRCIRWILRVGVGYSESPGLPPDDRYQRAPRGP